jgi:hypothetical protein
MIPELGIMHNFRVLQRPLRVKDDARRPSLP